MLAPVYEKGVDTMAIQSTQESALTVAMQALVDAVDAEVQEGTMDPVDVDAAVIRARLKVLIDGFPDMVYFRVPEEGIVTSRAPQA